MDGHQVFCRHHLSYRDHEYHFHSDSTHIQKEACEVTRCVLYDHRHQFPDDIYLGVQTADGVGPRRNERE